jgi:hypothetical protein
MTTGRAALVCQQSHVHNPNKPNSSPRQRSHDQLPLVPSEPPDSQDLPSIHIRIDQQPGTEIAPLLTLATKMYPTGLGHRD